MSQSIDLKGTSKAIGKFLSRYHTVLFIVFTAACIAIALIIVVTINNHAVTTDTSSTQIINSSFDEATIKHLQELNSSNNSHFSFPSGRTNPFVE